MKILHTSDWHLGHLLYGYDRTEEQQCMLDQMVDIVRNEKPDVFILAGDVYHTPDPRPAVQEMFNSTIARMVKAHPEMTLVITAGNHDSGTKHEIFKTPWRAMNVHVLGRFDKDRLDSLVIEVPGKGWVVALPFVSERFMPDDIHEQLMEQVSRKNRAGLPVVLCAHTAIRGASFAGHDDVTEKRVGGVDVIDVNRLGSGYDYVALGHIHKPQFIHTGNHNVRYSGSPMDVSFDEAYEHSVTIVDIPSHGAKLQDSDYRFVPIANPRPLVTLPDPKDTSAFGKWEDVSALYRLFPAMEKVYIRLNIADPEMMPAGAYSKSLEQAEGKEYDFCYINSRTNKEVSSLRNRRQLDMTEFRALKPWDILKMYVEDTKDTSFSEEEMKPLFDRVLEDMTVQSREEGQQ